MLWSVVAAAALAGGYEIEVSVEGGEPGEALLAYYFGNKQYVKQTEALIDGTVTFSGEEALDPGLYIVSLPPKHEFFEVLIDEDQSFAISTHIDDLNGIAKVTGSEQNAAYFDYLRFLAGQQAAAKDLREKAGGGDQTEVAAKLEALDRAVQDRKQSLQSTHPHSLLAKLLKAAEPPRIPEALVSEEERYAYYREHFFDNVDFSDPRLLRTPVFQPKIDAYLTELTPQTAEAVTAAVSDLLALAKQNPEVWKTVSINLVNTYSRSRVMCFDSVYMHIVDEVYAKGLAPWADEEAIQKLTDRADRIRPSRCGQPAPKLFTRDASGAERSPAEVTTPFTVLWFWDYECGHCRTQTPELAKTMERLSDELVTLYTISISGTEDRWKEELVALGLSEGIHTQDHARTSGFEASYDFLSTPLLYVLDAEKTIVAKRISVEALEDFLLDQVAP